MWVWLRVLLAANVLRVEAFPCEAEISSACPDSPKSELADCLKDPSQHETPTDISSECTDFMALNTACSEEIEQLCDEEFFAENTIPCLLKYRASDEEISEKCQSVMQWALPEAEETESVTDELGMSEQDRQEKEEWRAKRRKGREDAIERMKMKEADAKKEAERRELEKFKQENPEAYEDMQKQKKEDERQAAEQKKRERLLKAAWERKRRIEAGEDPDAQTGPAPSSKGKSGKASGSWYSTIAALIILGVVGGIAYVIVTGTGGKGAPASGRGRGKKKNK